MSVAPLSPTDHGTSITASHSVLHSIPPQSILCLCLGNICRSPLAEGIIRRELETRKLKGWVSFTKTESILCETVDSAGTSGEHDGEAPDDRSIAVAKRHGIDIAQHQSRRLTAADWNKFHFILAMDSSNYRNALRVKPKNGQTNNSCTAELIMYLPEGRDVPDPWYGSAAGFTDCYNLLHSHVDHTFHRIAKHHQRA